MTIPLDPGAGGRSIDSSALQIADIIVSTTSAFVSAIIRAGTSSEVSHSALFIGGDQVVEAIGEGVVLRDLATSLSDDRLAVAYRLPDLTSDQALKIRDYVGNQLGLPYSVKGALGAGFSYVSERAHMPGCGPAPKQESVRSQHRQCIRQTRLIPSSAPNWCLPRTKMQEFRSPEDAPKTLHRSISPTCGY
jgi:hypothetical protein